MNKAFEKILKKIEEKRNKYQRLADGSNFDGWHEEDIKYSAKAEMCEELKEIVQEVSKEYKGGWIPCSERLPEECVPVNVTWINRKPEPYYAKIKDVPFSATAVYYNGKWYWYSSTCVDYLSEYGKNDFDLIDKDIDIISWQPLPEPFKECD